jgi:hypothetical protein
MMESGERDFLWGQNLNVMTRNRSCFPWFQYNKLWSMYCVVEFLNHRSASFHGIMCLQMNRIFQICARLNFGESQLW